MSALLPYRVVFVLLKIISSITLKCVQTERNVFPASEGVEENPDHRDVKPEYSQTYGAFSVV